MKPGDLVKYTGRGFQDWLGYVTREIPGSDDVKVVKWWNKNGGTDISSHPARHLELLSENR